MGNRISRRSCPIIGRLAVAVYRFVQEDLALRIPLRRPIQSQPVVVEFRANPLGTRRDLPCKIFVPALKMDRETDGVTHSPIGRRGATSVRRCTFGTSMLIA